jgi:hypothetical protein
LTLIGLIACAVAVVATALLPPESAKIDGRPGNQSAAAQVEPGQDKVGSTGSNAQPKLPRNR